MKKLLRLEYNGKGIYNSFFCRNNNLKVYEEINHPEPHEEILKDFGESFRDMIPSICKLKCAFGDFQQMYNWFGEYFDLFCNSEIKVVELFIPFKRGNYFVANRQAVYIPKSVSHINTYDFKDYYKENKWRLLT